ncbi:hypothetical protein ACNOYE_15735 [Nannocystaceae bacterium ST9]
MPRSSSHTVVVASMFAVFTACVDDPASDDQADDGGSSEAESGTSEGETEVGETGESLAPTWHRDIAPLIAEKCSACHREGGIAPFAIGDYTQGAAWAELAFDAIERGDMPPWGQAATSECQPRHGFLGDPRFTDEQLELLGAWIEVGKPEGDPNDAAPLPEPPSLELADADLRLEMPSDVTVSPGQDQFWCFVVDPEFTSTQFIDGVQIDPGNDAIVHHVLVYVDDSGESADLADDQGRYECFGGPGLAEPRLLAAWAPGSVPSEMPEGVAMDIPAGAKLVVNVHYHPTGVETIDDATAIDVRFAKNAPQYFGQLALIGNFEGSIGGGMGLLPGPGDSSDAPEFRIPAGSNDHTETMRITLPAEVPELKLWLAGTHMHYVGTDMIIGIDRAEPEQGTNIDEECLIQTPNYSFEWQRGYRYDAPLDQVPTLRAGDTLSMRCNYDNSMSNPHVVDALAEQGLDAPIDVFLGEETLDEMCLGVFGIAYGL